MNGPQHYADAESFLERAAAPGIELGGDMERYYLAAAQVHATLALTAATVDAAYGDLSIPADAAWGAVLGVDR